MIMLLVGCVWGAGLEYWGRYVNAASSEADQRSLFIDPDINQVEEIMDVHYPTIIVLKKRRRDPGHAQQATT